MGEGELGNVNTSFLLHFVTKEMAETGLRLVLYSTAAGSEPVATADTNSNTV